MVESPMMIDTSWTLLESALTSEFSGIGATLLSSDELYQATNNDPTTTTARPRHFTPATARNWQSNTFFYELSFVGHLDKSDSTGKMLRQNKHANHPTKRHAISKDLTMCGEFDNKEQDCSAFLVSVSVVSKV
jgi:hypothetical protein